MCVILQFLVSVISHCVILFCSDDFIEFIIPFSYKLIYFFFQGGQTAVKVAVVTGHTQALCYLLKVPGINIDACGKVCNSRYAL